MWAMVPVVGDALRYTRTVDSKIVATYVSLTTKQPSEWLFNEQADMGSCAHLAKTIVVKLSGPTQRDDYICCSPYTGSHWSSIEDGRIASARCPSRVVCRHIEGVQHTMRTRMRHRGERYCQILLAGCCKGGEAMRALGPKTRAESFTESWALLIGQPTSFPDVLASELAARRILAKSSISTTCLCVSGFRCRDCALTSAGDSKLSCGGCQACTPATPCTFTFR
jgi:hypothetical protein